MTDKGRERFLLLHIASKSFIHCGIEKMLLLQDPYFCKVKGRYSPIKAKTAVRNKRIGSLV